MVTTEEKNTSTLLQVSAFAQYFFPFGNFIFPVIIWSSKKNDSGFVDYNGKQAINFQLSLLMYSLLLLVVSIPFIIYKAFKGTSLTINDCDWVIERIQAGEITGVVIISVLTIILLASLKVMEFFLILYAAIKNSNGETYNFPLTIKFIK
ncbi:DUF4870 domain-containing protein [Flavobacterium sp. MK4S-17]|uniref:DUF4870 domain-containing protein n=1 Tax=Flavobacterium sp. MK4S-17 TaxID=2543737 RepID=UPI001358D461|nr:DUF4870 domain-containing protein [Flavobacterium sp. MK4S-17]